MMFVIAQNNRTYAKLSFNVGPGGQVLIPIEIDYSQDFAPSNHELWDAEYAANVKAAKWLTNRKVRENSSTRHDLKAMRFRMISLKNLKGWNRKNASLFWMNWQKNRNCGTKKAR